MTRREVLIGLMGFAGGAATAGAVAGLDFGPEETGVVQGQRPREMSRQTWRVQTTEDWTKINAASPDRVQMVHVPGRNDPVMRATVKQGDFHEKTNGARAEGALTSLRIKEGDESILRWSVQFPESFVPPEKWGVFTQFHHRLGDPGYPEDRWFSPPVELVVHGEQMKLRTMAGMYEKTGRKEDVVLWEEPLQRGRWLDFELPIKWSQDEREGRVSLNFKGKSVLKNVPTANMYEDGEVFLAQGWYRDTGKGNPDQTLYHAGTELEVVRYT